MLNAFNFIECTKYLHHCSKTKKVGIPITSTVIFIHIMHTVSQL